MSSTDRDGGRTRTGDARTEDTRPRTAREAERDAANLGESAADDANQPGTATDEAESRVQEAVEAAQELADQPGGTSQPGRRVNRRSPFWIGMTGAFGVAVTYGLVELFVRARSILIIVGLALFIAVGLDPVVSWLTRRGWPRWAAVTTVLVAVAAVIGGFLAAAVPPLTSQTTALAHQIPTYLHQLQNHNSELGKLNAKYHIQTRLTSLLSSRGSALIGGVLGAGELVISTFSEILAVIVLTIYFLAGLPTIKLFFYRLIPHSRRPRVILITDQITVKVGGYVLGNVLTSVIAGLGTFIWLVIFGIPYPVLLALLDLIPVIGSTIGGFIVTLIALTVSLPVAVATLIFYVVYRLAEDYLIVPRVMGRTVEVPAVVSLVAVLLGGVLLGIVGALVAIPIAAAINLILREVTFPRMDRS